LARRVDLLKDFDDIASLPQPIEAFGRDIGIDNDTASSFSSSDHDYPKLVAKFG
jgi:hypothetical protein